MGYVESRAVLHIWAVIMIFSEADMVCKLKPVGIYGWDTGPTDLYLSCLTSTIIYLLKNMYTLIFILWELIPVTAEDKHILKVLQDSGPTHAMIPVYRTDWNLFNVAKRCQNLRLYPEMPYGF